MSVRSLRIWSGIGAGILTAGLILLAFGVAFWKPLSTAPDLWAMTTWALVGVGLIVTVIATATLATRSRRE
ncbi:hypothetical protein BJQ94_13645 [Cryobacterium sp. SO2]|uniref:hypothetical protein n=1 Tax=Cryobacterium sp. SO2 TaxID=1897060 RepID=UPI00223D66BA|nr:hypothetical protein [Cryobacterium sp. SO2]WEO76403.1 hypothetical protein BJQ94_13645 [Cryobacterium sp. SO2]